jgi:recombination protein RecT
MNTVATVERPTRLDAYMAEVLPPDKRESLFRGLPRHIRPELFERNLANAIMAQPDLLKCHPSEVYREVAQIAALGLMLDPQLGEAWLIAGYSTKHSRHQPQRRVGYRGLIKLARQSGELSTIYAREVHENDQFDADLYRNDINHTADLFGDRGPVIGFYAVARFKDGSEDFEPMSVAEAERIRDRYSDGWKAWKSGKMKRAPIWETDFGEMAKKTVLRRLIKRLPQSPELAEALQIDNIEEEQPAPALSPPRGRPRLAAALEQAAAQPRPPEPTPMPQPQPIPPQPEDDEPDEDPNEPGTDQGDGMGYDTREEKRMDQEPLPKSEMYDEERTRLYAAGLAAANLGARKLRFWKAKQMPEELAKLTPEDLKQLETIGKEADKQAPADG